MRSSGFWNVSAGKSCEELLQKGQDPSLVILPFPFLYPFILYGMQFRRLSDLFSLFLQAESEFLPSACSVLPCRPLLRFSSSQASHNPVHGPGNRCPISFLFHRSAESEPLPSEVSSLLFRKQLHCSSSSASRYSGHVPGTGFHRCMLYFQG